ncbi:DUF4245 family protein [Nocardioides bruguierae]|uniref:DUF4245 family protein n=1 Tax=Nocardioides bruguierae TaxID=2945102 RepID=UPI002020B102|nr:DUF4245 family protein [Nocardioides bruguierae]MCL8025781.1 DUF4245 family protein [Nocardioides bruguierae]
MSQDASAPEPAPEKPGRYQRTTGGLIGSMIVMVVVVVVAWQAFGAFRDDEVSPVGTDIAYPDVADALALSDGTWVYPASLPAGWVLNTDPRIPSAEGFVDLAILTDHDSDEETGFFVGVHVEDEDVDELVDTYVDAAARDEGVYTLEGASAGVPSEWETWTDEGGDTAYTATIGRGGQEKSVIVYGSAPAEDLQEMLGLLVSTRG